MTGLDRMLSLTDYRSVVALYEERHFTRAAQSLGVTQPSLTSRLRRVEAHLGLRLFERGRRGVEPTAAGVSFTESARQIIDLAEQAAITARGAERGFAQTLRLGMTQIAAVQLAVPILASFRDEQPRARIHLVESTSLALERQVAQNLLDAAFLHPPVHEPGLSERLLMSQRLAKYDARRKGAPALPLIRYVRKEAPVLMAEIDRKDPHGGDIDGQIEVDSVLGAIVLSHAGYGPVIVPAGFPNPLDADAGFERVAIEVELGTSLIWRSLDRRPMIRTLVDVCRRSARR